MSKLKRYYEYADNFHKEPAYHRKSLSRLVDYINQYDCGSITAYRRGYTHIENLQRDRSLLAKLAAMTYGITIVKGTYIENILSDNAKAVGEYLFFVVDVRKRKNLIKMLCDLGEEFEQDSILYIPEGGEKSYLIGTNINSFPGCGECKELPVIQSNNYNCEFLAHVAERPFCFKNEILSERYCGNNLGLWAASTEAKKSWRDLQPLGVTI